MTVKQTSCIYGEEFGASGRSETDPHTYFFDSSSSASAKTSSKSNPSPADISFSPSASSLSISRSCSPFLYASKLSNTAAALPPRVTTTGPLDFCTRFSAADASCCSSLNGIVLRALAIFLPPTISTSERILAFQPRAFKGACNSFLAGPILERGNLGLARTYY